MQEIGVMVHFDFKNDFVNFLIQCCLSLILATVFIPFLNTTLTRLWRWDCVCLCTCILYYPILQDSILYFYS